MARASFESSRYVSLLHWGLPLKYYNLRWNYFLSGGIWNVLEKDISISSQIARELCHSSLSGAFETSTFSKFVISHFKGWPFMSIIISFHSMFYYLLGNAHSAVGLHQFWIPKKLWTNVEVSNVPDNELWQSSCAIWDDMEMSFSRTFQILSNCQSSSLFIPCSTMY